MEPFRELNWNVPVHGWLYILLIPTLVIFLYGFYIRLWPCLSSGKEKGERFPLNSRVRNFWKEAIWQQRLRRQGLAGTMHVLTFWGMIGLLIATVLVSSQAYLGFQVLRGYFYLIVLALAADLAGAAALAGSIMALYRRFIRREKRLSQESNGSNFAVFLLLLLAVLISGFLVEGLRIAAVDDPWAIWSPVGWIFASPFNGQAKDSLLRLHKILWWFHGILAFGLIAYLPFSPLAHSILAFFSAWTRFPSRAGTLPMPLGKWEGNFAPTGNPRYLTGKEVLDVSACVECGRCQEVCPATIVGRPLSPRKFLLGIRQGILTRSCYNLDPDVIWSCTTCAACTEECPILIEHVTLMVDYRRFLVEKGNVPATMLQALESMAHWGIPGISPRRNAGTGPILYESPWPRKQAKTQKCSIM